jgi:hypothetical protein
MSASFLAIWTRSSVPAAWKSAPRSQATLQEGRLMAHITRRHRNGKVRYLARYTDPSGRERAKSFTRKKDAERFLTGIENDKPRGTWTDPALGRVALADWYALWRRATVELRPNTEARDERLFRLHILPRFGSMPLVAITHHKVRVWVTHATRQGLAASTVRRAYQLLGKVLGAGAVGCLWRPSNR